MIGLDTPRIGGTNVLAGIAKVAAYAGLLNQGGAKKIHRWTLTNEDTGEKIEGQFAPINPTEKPIISAYAEHTSLGREKPILMYTKGNSAEFSFGILFYALSEDDDLPAAKIQALKTWARRRDNLGRPPLVSFSVGNGDLQFGPAVIVGIGDISYFDPMKHGGGIRGVNTSVTLRAYTTWSVISVPPPETRYHHAKIGEYFEFIAYHEYGSPLLGVVIRHRNPEIVELEAGDTVPLPSLDAIKTESTAPNSKPFSNILLKKSGIEKDNRNLVFGRKNVSYFSALIPEGL